MVTTHEEIATFIQGMEGLLRDESDRALHSLNDIPPKTAKGIQVSLSR